MVNFSQKHSCGIMLLLIFVILTGMISYTEEQLEKFVKFPSHSPAQTHLRHLSVLLCDSNTKFTSLRCPLNMEVRMQSAIYGHAKSMLTQQKAIQSVNQTDSFLYTMRRRHSRKKMTCVSQLKADQNSLLPHTFSNECNYDIRDLAMDIQNSCDNNETCDISRLNILKQNPLSNDYPKAVSKFKTNRNSCSMEHYLLIRYTCVPKKVTTELIMADSYLELGCMKFPGSDERILVINATLTANTTLNPGEKVDYICPDVDKTAYLSSICNTKDSCTAEPPKSTRAMVDRGCRKMNLKLTYTCMQNSFFVQSGYPSWKETQKGKNSGMSKTKAREPNQGYNPARKNSLSDSTFHPNSGPALESDYKKDKRSKRSFSRDNVILIVAICTGVVIVLLLILMVIFIVRRFKTAGRRSTNASDKSGSTSSGGAKRNHRSKSNSLSKMYGPDGSEKFLPPASPHLPPAPRYRGVDLLPYNASLTLTDTSNPLSAADTYSENLSSPPIPPHYHETANPLDSSSCLLPPPMPFSSSIGTNLTNQMYGSHHQDSNFSLPINGNYQTGPLSRASTSSTSGGSISTFYTINKKENTPKETIITLPYNTSHLTCGSVLSNPSYPNSLTHQQQFVFSKPPPLESWH